MERSLHFVWMLSLLELGRYDRIDKLLEHHILCHDSNNDSSNSNSSSSSDEIHAIPTLCAATQLFWRLHVAGQDTSALLQQLHDGWRAVNEQDEDEDEQGRRVALTPLEQVQRHVSARETHRTLPHSVCE